jgi:hypothetical protein
MIKKFNDSTKIIHLHEQELHKYKYFCKHCIIQTIFTFNLIIN